MKGKILIRVLEARMGCPGPLQRAQAFVLIQFSFGRRILSEISQYSVLSP